MFKELFRRIMFFDRRRFKRHKLEDTIEGRCFYEDDGRPVQCLIAVKNFSKNGVLLVTGDKKLNPNTPIQLHFQLPHSTTPVVIPGKVVRTYRYYMESFYRSGIKFQKPNTDQVRSLLKFALEQQE